MKMSQRSEDLERFVQSILSGDLTVGEIVRQKELCDILGISMSPLRELLILLEELDLVEVKPRAGFKISYPNFDFMRDNMQFRSMIESHAIGIFVEAVTDEWIENSVAIHKEALAILETGDKASEDIADTHHIERGFHKAIVGSMENTAISKAHDYTLTKLRIGEKVHRRAPPRKAEMANLQDHLAILTALKTRNLKAVRDMLDEHFTNDARTILLGA